MYPGTVKKGSGRQGQDSPPELRLGFSPQEEDLTMGTITTTDGVEIFYKDWGSGQPIVFSHGWPLSSDDWDTQMLFFLGHGYRVVAHDRRGHGRSSQTGEWSRHGPLRR
jgi:alpha-beta hydrolase superfamily lysophospholipase